jgi:hypothetical protein
MKNNCFLLGLFFATWVVSAQNVTADKPTNSAVQPASEGTYWGAETNGVKAGLYIEKLQGLAGLTNRVPLQCHPLLYNSVTNNGNLAPGMLMLYLPEIESRYRLEFTDEKGNAVKKTTKGKALGKPVPQSSNPATGVKINTGWRAGKCIIVAKEVYGLPEFMLQDYFKINDSGTYHLHFEMSALKPSPNDADKVELIRFPPVDVEVQISLNK